jgi:hypothetical protein
VDIIALDLSRRLPFRLRPGPVQAAAKRGVHFEICYAAALRSEAARRHFFANATGAPPFPWSFCHRAVIWLSGCGIFTSSTVRVPVLTVMNNHF